MRETSFIKQNKEKWQDFEQILEQEDKDPDKLNDLFVEITDDLSYSRTFYHNRSVRVYLNGLAQRIFFNIYKNKKSNRSRLITFWTDELPQLVYESRKAFQLSFWVFVIAFGIGVLSSVMDADFVRVILGDTYVDMTLENIESGDPMAVYKQKGEFGMSIGITANNLFVAFRTFVMGVFYAIGTIAILLFNGIMVGAFQYFFVEQGVFWESFLTIWTHGTLEISAIIIAGAAGLTMGKGLVFPGTLSRLKAFQVSARRGVKIMVGITPIFILAGFIEGFLTRQTHTPDSVRLLFILVCLAFIIGYFVIYPRIKAQRGFAENLRDTALMPDKQQGIDFKQIKNRGTIFGDTFFFYRKHFKKLLWTAVGTAALYICLVFYLTNYQPQGVFSFFNDLFSSLRDLHQFFVNDHTVGLFFINILTFSLLTHYTHRTLLKEERQLKHSFKQQFTQFLKALLPSTLAVLLLQTNNWYTPFLVLLLFPHLMLWNFVMLREKVSIFQGLQRAHFLAGHSYGRVLGLFLVLLLTGMLFFLLLDTPFLWTFLEFIAMNFAVEDSAKEALGVLMMAFTNMLFFYLEVIFFLTGIGLLYYTLLEIKDAPTLKLKIKQISPQRRIKGLEQEF